MRVDKGLPKQDIQLPGQSHAAPAADSRPGLAPGATLSSRIRAPELRQFASNLQQVPELRQEVVGDVIRRLGQGEYVTSKAADQTVQAMLGAANRGE
jgi:hypothetical protein